MKQKHLIYKKMKTIKFIFALLALSMGMACSEKDTPKEEIIIGGDCDPQPFSVTYASYKNDPDIYFIKGEVVDVVQHGNEIKIIQDFKNNFESNTIITVWGSGRICPRIDPLYKNHRTDTLLLFIKKTDLLENLLCPQCEHYEQPDDYMTMGCYFSVLKLSNGTVSGRITDIYGDTTMLWADFVTQFEITK
ncbi:MAG: hypothetical protein LBF08_03700 [Dysgonamonadaceae bacterium]|jgi:hypothetical protein|nr:hypothetical protein [Dysgonamonadaceae bacterium]